MAEPTAPSIVVDASVAIQWFVPDHGSAMAARLLDGAVLLLALDTLPVEIANGLWRRERLASVAPLDIAGAVAALAAGALRLQPAGALLPSAIELARRIGRPVPECLYVALAAEADARLVTANPNLLARLAPTIHARRAVTLDRLSDLLPARAGRQDQACARENLSPVANNINFDTAVRLTVE